MAYTGNITGTIGSGLPATPTGQNWRRNEILFFQINVTEDFYPGFVRIYHRDDTPSRLMAVCLYDDVAGVPVNLLASASETSVAGGGTLASTFTDIEFGTHPELTSGTYWMGAWLNGSGFALPVGVSDFTFPALTRKLSQFNDTFPDPISGLSSSTFDPAIQFRYEAVASATPIGENLTIKYTLGQVTAIGENLTIKYTLGDATAVFDDLTVKYRLGTGTLTTNNTDYVTPGTASNNVADPAVFNTATSIGADTAMVSTGALQNPSPTTLPAGTGLRDYHAYGDIYFRIWSVPRTLRLQNPGINRPIPFTIWSAFNESNTLNTITGTGQTGLTLDITPPSVFGPVEERELNVTIGATAPVTVDAVFQFNFALATGLFDFNAVVAQFLAVIPEVPVTETWEWLSDVIIAWDGTEQRISTRLQPRITLDSTVAIDDDEDRQQQYNLIFQSIGQSVAIPFFHLGTQITATSAEATSEIFFDRDSTDVRDGELAFVLRPTTGEGFLFRMQTVTATGATLEAPLTAEIRQGDRLFPAFMSFIRDNSTLSMGQLAGEVAYTAQVTEPRSSTARPNSGASLVMFDSLPVLEEPALARRAGDENFTIDYDNVDSETGLVAIRTHWDHAFINGSRQFYTPRAGVSPMMDYWRLFLDTVDGQRGPFLFPSRREDLFLVGAGVPSATQITIAGSDYQTQYFEHDTYKRLRLVNTVGATHYTAVQSVTADGDNTILSIDPPVPSEPEWTDFEIEFLNKVRLANDRVRWDHFSRYSILTLNLRTTDQ